MSAKSDDAHVLAVDDLDAHEIVAAAHVLAALELVTAYGHVSHRSGTGMVITPAADLAHVTVDGLVEVSLDAEILPARAPAEAWAHLAIYRARPDIHSVARAQPAAAFAAAATATRVPILYGQAAWLGESVPVHASAHLLRSPERADAAAAALPSGEALLLQGNGALTLGTAPGLAVARMWLLGALCEAWLALGAARDDAAMLTAATLTAEEIASWRAVGPELLPRLWMHLQARAGVGERGQGVPVSDKEGST